MCIQLLAAKGELTSMSGACNCICLLEKQYDPVCRALDWDSGNLGSISIPSNDLLSDLGEAILSLYASFSPAVEHFEMD